MEEKKVLLSVKDLVVKFHVRGRILTAIRGISLDIYENESIAIVGESGSGKSVFTKTFAGMLDSNGFIDGGQILYNDPDLAETYVKLTGSAKSQIAAAEKEVNEYSKLQFGAETYKELQALEDEKRARMELSAEEEEKFDSKIADLTYERTELYNKRQTYNPKTERDLMHEASQKMKDYDDQIKKLEADKEAAIKAHKASYKTDTEFHTYYNNKKAELEKKYAEEIAQPISEETRKRNEIIAKEMYLSGGRYGKLKGKKLMRGLKKAVKKAMTFGVDLDDLSEREKIFDTVAFYVKYVDETPWPLL